MVPVHPNTVDLMRLGPRLSHSNFCSSSSATTIRAVSFYFNVIAHRVTAFLSYLILYLSVFILRAFIVTVLIANSVLKPLMLRFRSISASCAVPFRSR